MSTASAALLSVVVFLLVSAAPIAAQRSPSEPRPRARRVPSPVAKKLASLPVREITVFKDGHAFVLRSEKVPLPADGTVRLTDLPTPVLGTFWPYVADPAARLSSVTASRQTARASRAATTVAELLRANPGAAVRVTETSGREHRGRIAGVPVRRPRSPTGIGPRYLIETAEGVEYAEPDDSPPTIAETLLLETHGGLLALPVGLIRTVSFEGKVRREMVEERQQTALRLQIESGRPAPAAEVGMVYLQKGIRWIPEYRVALDGRGTATVRLQATLINELVDLEKVTANLVIGVANFYFKDNPDPISLREVFPALTRFFEPDSETGLAFSQAIMSRPGAYGGGLGGVGFGGGFAGGRGGRCSGEEETPDEGQAGGQDAAAGEKSEDLFVFTVRNVSLKKGESMVVPIAEYGLEYRDVFTLELPEWVPAEVAGDLPAEQRGELARLLRIPRAQHKIRLANRGSHPLTTAPALIVRGNQVLAQSLMSFTPPGQESDLAVTATPDVRARKEERETGRTPNALQHRTDSYHRVDLAGTLTISNTGPRGLDLEVTRYVPGEVDRVDQGGVAERLSPVDEEGEPTARSKSRSSWPLWWSNVNGRTRLCWRLQLEPGKSVDLGYAWHYFWH